MKRKQFLIFIGIVLLLLGIDYAYNNYSITTTEQVNKITEYKSKYEETSEKNTELEERIAILEEELDIAKEENIRLWEDYSEIQRINRSYSYSDTVARNVFLAVVNSETAKLKELTASNIEVFDDYFGITHNGVTTKVAFKHLQTAEYNPNELTLESRHFGFEDNTQSLRITYHIKLKNSLSIICNMDIKEVEDTSTAEVHLESKLVNIILSEPI